MQPLLVQQSSLLFQRHRQPPAILNYFNQGLQYGVQQKLAISAQSHAQNSSTWWVRNFLRIPYLDSFSNYAYLLTVLWSLRTAPTAVDPTKRSCEPYCCPRHSLPRHSGARDTRMWQVHFVGASRLVSAKQPPGVQSYHHPTVEFPTVPGTPRSEVLLKHLTKSAFPFILKHLSYALFRTNSLICRTFEDAWLARSPKITYMRFFFYSQLVYASRTTWRSQGTCLPYMIAVLIFYLRQMEFFPEFVKKTVPHSSMYMKTTEFEVLYHAI